MSNSIGQNERLNCGEINILNDSDKIFNAICKYIHFNNNNLILNEDTINNITNIELIDRKGYIKDFLKEFILSINIIELKREVGGKIKKAKIVINDDVIEKSILYMLNTAVHNFLQSYNILNSIQNDIILIDGQNLIGNIVTPNARGGIPIYLFNQIINLVKSKIIQNNLSEYKKYIEQYSNKTLSIPSEIQIFKNLNMQSKSFSLDNGKTGSIYSNISTKKFLDNLILKTITELLSSKEHKVICFGLRDVFPDRDKLVDHKKYMCETSLNNYIVYSEGMGYNVNPAYRGVDYVSWIYEYDGTDDFCLILTNRYLTKIGKVNSVISNDYYGWVKSMRPCRTKIQNLVYNPAVTFDLTTDEFQKIRTINDKENINIVSTIFDIHDKIYKISQLRQIEGHVDNIFATRTGFSPALISSPICISDEEYNRELSKGTIQTSRPSSSFRESDRRADDWSRQGNSRGVSDRREDDWRGSSSKKSDGRADKEDDWRGPSSKKSDGRADRADYWR